MFDLKEDKVSFKFLLLPLMAKPLSLIKEPTFSTNEGAWSLSMPNFSFLQAFANTHLSSLVSFIYCNFSYWQFQSLLANTHLYIKNRLMIQLDGWINNFKDQLVKEENWNMHFVSERGHG
jgi:hypothetical protein